MRKAVGWLSSLTIGLSACGYGSVNPIFADRDVQFTPTLVGTWTDSTDGERVSIIAEGSTGYSLVYRDSDGKSGQFHARLGRLGSHQALDIQPMELPDSLNDVYKSLYLPLHAPMLIQLTEDTLWSQVLEPDPIKDALGRNPTMTPHIAVSDAIVLTGSSLQVQHFLATMVQRPGVLGEISVWYRVAP